MSIRISRHALQIGHLTVTREMVIPHMRWWEWAWYVPAVIASGLAYDRLSDWLDPLIAPLPVIGWFSWLITLIILSVVFTGISYLTLPARKARKATPGEPVLAVGLWLCGVGLQWLFSDYLPW